MGMAAILCVATTWLTLAGDAAAQGARSAQLVQREGVGTALSELPQRRVRVSLKDMGANRPLTLRGVEGNASVDMSVRLDEIIDAATLHLNFTLSPALLPGLSHLKVFLNDELQQTLTFQKDQSGRLQGADVVLDPRFFGDFNRLRFQLIGHYTLDCESPEHSSLWANISNESYLDLSLRQLPLNNDLALLPAPFFDSRDNHRVVLPVVFAGQPSQGLLKASGSIATWIGALSAYRGSRFPVLHNALPDRHGVVLATNAARPDFLRELPPVEHPTLAVMAHPSRPGVKLLLVLGKDDAQVQRAADTLALGKAALSGERMRVTQLDYPARRAAYDAPRWISTERPVQLAELVQRIEELQVRGGMLNEAVRVNTRMAPDLFTWNANGVPLNLTYRYTPTNTSTGGSIDLSINDQFIRSFPLQSSENSVSANTSGNSTVMLPFFDDGTIQAKSDFKIPAFLIGGDNQLQFNFQIPPIDLGRCRSAQPPELRAAVDPQSTIDITGFFHYTAMPNMATFANSGFPFTKYADLAETAVVLPKKASTTEIELYLTALSRMAAATGYAGTRFQLLDSSQWEQARDHDVLLIASADHDDVLSRLGNNIPALIEAGKRAIRPLDQALGRWRELFNLESETNLVSQSGKTLLEGTGPLAAMAGFESPLNSGRTVIALSATDEATLGLLSEALNDTGKIQTLRGDLVLFRGAALESFRINPVYYVGDMPWWRKWWFYLHSHPTVLALFGIVSGLLLTFMVYVSLRAMARRRLGRGHG